MVRKGAFGCKSERNRLKLFLVLFLCDFVCCLGLNGEGFALLRFKERVARDPFNALSSWNAGADDADPCSWFGVACSGGRVVALSLKDMSLRGTLPAELGKLAHVKSIILRNNSFYGTIPREIVALKELKVLDLGYNNFTGPLPPELDKVFVGMLLLDNNSFLDGIFAGQNESMLFEDQADEYESRTASARDNCGDKLVGWNMDYLLYSVQRSLLQTSRDSKANGDNDTEKLSVSSVVPSLPPSSHAHRGKSSPLPPQRLPHKLLTTSSSKRLPAGPAPSPLPSPKSSPSPSPSSSPSLSPFPFRKFIPPASAPTRSKEAASSSKKTPTVARTVSSHSGPFPALVLRRKVGKSHVVLIGIFAAGGSLVIIASVFAIILCRSSKMVAVQPWAMGLSGQQQRAFVSGVSKLKRSELETACEDFSNIIGTSEDSTVYKGTLSDGVEIAVVSSSAKSTEEWSKHLETQFRKKIETLSKLKHRNFVNLLGYCQEEKPFTRMMVFEYAPNGTLFEHLHVKEAERLDWRTRMRIITGMAYCLVHMHELDPPAPHRDLQSSSIYLSQDYAAKVSDLSFRTATTTANKLRSPSFQLLEASMADRESNVHSFGLLLLETITGKIPYSAEDGTVEDWVWDNLSVEDLPRDAVDPTLDDFNEDEVKKLFEIMKECVHPDPSQRPTMVDVASRVKRVTGIEPDRATPRQSPLWWVELDISFSELDR